MALLLYSVTRIESFSLSICNGVHIYGNIDGDLRVASQTGSRVNIYGNVGEQGGLRFASASDDNSTTEKEKSAGISGHAQLIIYSFPNPLSTFSIYAVSLSRLL